MVSKEAEPHLSDAASTGLMSDGEKQTGNPDDRLGMVAAVSYMVNSCMGVGFLTLPYAFSRSGIMASSVCVLVLGALSITGILFLIDSMARVAAINFKRGTLDDKVEERLLKVGTRDAANPFDLVGNLDVGTICNVLYGRTQQRLCVVLLSVSTSLVLWVQASMVGSALADLDWISGSSCNVYVDGDCIARYRVCLGCFGAVVLLLAGVSLNEQKWFQICMTGVRAVLCVFLITDSARMIIMGERVPIPSKESDLAKWKPALVFDTEFGHLAQVISLVAYSLGFHVVLPEILQEVGEKRRIAVTTSMVGTGVSVGAYMLIGITVAAAFGSWTLPVCTLNWANADLGGLQNVMLLLPVLDLTSSFPLWAHSMGNNIHSAMKTSFPGVPVWAWRVLGAIGPIIGAWFVYDITILVTWTGVIVTVLCYVCPVVIWKKACEESEGLYSMAELARNPYRVDTSPFLANAALVSGIIVGSLAFAGAVLHGDGRDPISASTPSSYISIMKSDTVIGSLIGLRDMVPGMRV